MKLLIITQKADRNDPILGFFHGWIREFAKHFESVAVICLEKGDYDFPENVKVFSLGKEERQSRLQYLIHFYWYIAHERKNYDAVFVHMNQIYVVLGGLLWKIWHKKIMLWYTHRAVSPSLRIAAFFSDLIFTATKESFNIKSNKVHVIEHGIDVEQFKNERTKGKSSGKNSNSLFLLSVGRITRIKNLETLVEACWILKSSGVHFTCDIIGPKVTPDDTLYFNSLCKMVKEKEMEGQIVFLDAVSNQKIREYYWKSDVNINLAPTGGIDKVVLEGIAAGIIPLVSNEAFAPIFGQYAGQIIFKYKDAQDLADKIMKMKENKNEKMMEDLKKNIKENYSTESVINKICKEI